ncbi:MAG: quinolinate synthase NadA, partial [Coriobacteriales bacterium]
STKGIITQVASSDSKEFIIATVIGVQHQMEKLTEGSGKRFYFPKTTPICPDMQKITLEDVRDALLNSTGEVPPADSNCRENARRSLSRMLELSK